MTTSSRLRIGAQLFWTFLKVNLLTSSGPASVGLIYKEVVGKIMEEERFVEAVGFSNVVPGSEALKLAMFIGYSAGGIGGAISAILGAILPPIGSMLIVTLAVSYFEEAPWMKHFIQGMAPALAMLITVAAWKIFYNGRRLRKRAVFLAVLCLVGLYFNVLPAALVFLAGTVGIWLFR
uniref:Chromate transporter n=1 Tax=uncultured Chloroflexota bacterium TaxID=166587 RepID=H5SL52_9CHLR|nr:chromate transporter [uncultured Chloroflexota bacterium]BAL56888.1 chromate transporter [uncultured Chloroflexota bacterium]